MKYTQDEIVEMAKQFKAAFVVDQNDPRCKEVLVRLLIEQGYPPQYSWDNIQKLAGSS